MNLGTSKFGDLCGEVAPILNILRKAHKRFAGSIGGAHCVPSTEYTFCESTNRFRDMLPKKAYRLLNQQRVASTIASNPEEISLASGPRYSKAWLGSPYEKGKLARITLRLRVSGLAISRSSPANPLLNCLKLGSEALDDGFTANAARFGPSTRKRGNPQFDALCLLSRDAWVLI